MGDQGQLQFMHKVLKIFDFCPSGNISPHLVSLIYANKRLFEEQFQERLLSTPTHMPPMGNMDLDLGSGISVWIVLSLLLTIL